MRNNKLWSNYLTVIIASLLLIVLFIAIASIPIDDEFVKSGTLKYLGSSIIQSFAALIAIPFAFYASYLHNKYGYAGLQFAVNRVKEYVFPLFALVAILSILLIMFPNYPDIPNFGVKYDNLLRILLFTEFFISALLLIIIYRHLIEVMTVTPSKLAEWIISRRKNKSENTIPPNILYKSKMISELLIISLEDLTLHQDSEEVLKQLLELLKTYHLEVDENLDLSTEAKILTQLFGLIDSIITTLEDRGQVISRDAVGDLVKVLSEIYFQFLIRQDSELSDINIDTLVSERIQRLHKTFYNITTRLSLLYSVNFYKVVYHNLHTPDNTELLIENTARLIENTLKYLKTSIYLDQKEDFAGAPRTSAAISGVDFIFDLLSRLEEKEIEQILANSREKLVELISLIKNLLIPPAHYTGSVSLYPLVFSGKEPIYIDNKDIAFKVLSAWSRCILSMTNKIVKDNKDEQHQDHNYKVNTSLEESFDRIIKQTQKTREIISKLFDYNTSKYSEMPKDTGSIEWILNEILIDNIAELYEAFKCDLTFKSNDSVVFFWCEKLRTGTNVELIPQKFEAIYDYLQDTKLRKYIKWM